VGEELDAEELDVVELDAAVEVVEVVLTLVGVDEGVVITGVVVVETTVGEVYEIGVEVALVVLEQLLGQ